MWLNPSVMQSIWEIKWWPVNLTCCNQIPNWYSLILLSFDTALGHLTLSFLSTLSLPQFNLLSVISSWFVCQSYEYCMWLYCCPHSASRKKTRRSPNFSIIEYSLSESLSIIGISQPKKEMVIVYLPSCHSRPVWCHFISLQKIHLWRIITQLVIQQTHSDY